MNQPSEVNELDSILEQLLLETIEMEYSTGKYATQGRTFQRARAKIQALIASKVLEAQHIQNYKATQFFVKAKLVSDVTASSALAYLDTQPQAQRESTK